MRKDEEFDEKLIEVLRVVFQAPQYQPPPLGTPPEFVHRDGVALSPERLIDEGANEGLLAFDRKLEVIGGPKAIELALDELRARGISDPADDLIISIEGYSSLEKRLTQVMQSPPKTLEERQERMDLRKQIGAFRLRGQPPEIVLKKIASYCLSYLDRKVIFDGDVSECLFYAFRHQNLGLRQRPEKTHKFDVFKKDYTASFGISVGDEEVDRLCRELRVPYPGWLNGGLGLDIYELWERTRIREVWPKMLDEYVRIEFSGKQGVPTPEEFFKADDWRIGIG